MDLGISWTLTGLETAVFRGYSWLLVVGRGDTKTLANQGFLGDFSEHPQRCVTAIDSGQHVSRHSGHFL
jgi:muramidase (phage lysozyme)